MSIARIKGVFFRYYFSMIKGLHQLADLFYWPLVDILLWGLTTVWIKNQMDSVPMLPLMLMTALVFWQVAWRASVDISVNLLQEFWNRNLVNLFSTPLKISEWICGILLVCFCKLFISLAFCSLAVYLLYSLNVFSVGWSFIPFTALLLMFGWFLGLTAAGMIIYWGKKVEMFAWMIAFVFAPFSAVFYPVTVLPPWAQEVAWLLPTTYVFEGMRAILNGQGLLVSYIWKSLALNIIFLFSAALFFRYMFNKSRQKGLARLE
jgi:ABC-2 type transport system permease protein